LRVRSVSREEVWASAGVQGAWVGGWGCEAYKGVFVFVEPEALFVVVLLRDRRGRDKDCGWPIFRDLFCEISALSPALP